LAAFGSGLAITFLPLVVLLVLKVLRNGDPSDITALKIVLWPIIVLSHMLPLDTPVAVIFIVGLMFTVFLYSWIIYLAMAWRSKGRW
jgi:hypothetical protein